MVVVVVGGAHVGDRGQRVNAALVPGKYGDCPENVFLKRILSILRIGRVLWAFPVCSFSSELGLTLRTAAVVAVNQYGTCRHQSVTARNLRLPPVPRLPPNITCRNPPPDPRKYVLLLLAPTCSLDYWSKPLLPDIDAPTFARHPARLLVSFGIFFFVFTLFALPVADGEQPRRSTRRRLRRKQRERAGLLCFVHGAGLSCGGGGLSCLVLHLLSYLPMPLVF